ncbi:MAG: hypothetical protein Fur0037_26590 [Planctomycetota bacterium]
MTSVPHARSYRNERPYPFCPGCGHSAILDRLNGALERTGFDPDRVVIVSDIGCSGLSDQYFGTHAFHGLHGRSLTYATGIKLARPDLHVIVLIGDGGTGIGGTHLLQAARRNIGVTVLVFDNFNFGMTGGQHSVTTPPGARTSTTPFGNLERPLDICATVAANGASYVFRGTSFDPDLEERIAEALRTDGFSLLDIWELCTAHFVPRNKASKRTLNELAQKLGFSMGLLRREPRPEYAASCREAVAGLLGSPLREMEPVDVVRRLSPKEPFRIVVAGSAGGRVQSAAGLFAVAAMAGGLFATHREDYPVTVRTGHSIAELILSPREIRYTGIERPDLLVAVSRDGLAKVGRRLEAMTGNDSVVALDGLVPIETRARVAFASPPRDRRLKPDSLALFLLARAARDLGFLPRDLLEHAARRSPWAEDLLAAIGAAFD